MKKNLEILEIEAKLTKDEKKYWRVKTGQGWMSVFDVVAKDAIKETHNHSDNGMVCCEVIEKKGTDFKGEEKIFYNITKCYGATEVLEGTNIPKTFLDEKPEVVRPGVTPTQTLEMATPGEIGTKKNNNNLGTNKTASMYTSYAKDVFCALAVSLDTIKDKDDSKTAGKYLMELSIELVEQAKEAFE